MYFNIILVVSVFVHSYLKITKNYDIMSLLLLINQYLSISTNNITQY